MAAICDCGFELMQDLPYSSDLAPSDFHLFPHLKKYLVEEKDKSNDNVICAVETDLEGQDVRFYAKGIQGLEYRWKILMNLGGNYVKKCKVFVLKSKFFEF